MSWAIVVSEHLKSVLRPRGITTSGRQSALIIICLCVCVVYNCLFVCLFWFCLFCFLCLFVVVVVVVVFFFFCLFVSFVLFVCLTLFFLFPQRCLKFSQSTNCLWITGSHGLVGLMRIACACVAQICFEKKVLTWMKRALTQHKMPQTQFSYLRYTR